MGDRGNICITKPDWTPWAYLYSHWQGSDLPDILKKALTSAPAKSRWDDAGYLSRILFSQIIGDDWSDEYNWGLFWSVLDNEHDIIYVNIKKQQIKISEDGIVKSFAEFVK